MRLRGAARLEIHGLSGDISVEIGFIATRSTSGSPVVIPPSVPPARFVARAKPGMISSCTSSLAAGRLEPEPSSTPFTAGSTSTPARAGRRLSVPGDVRSEADWTPWAITSTMPPRVSPAAFAASIRATISRSASGSRQRTGLRSAVSFKGLGTGGWAWR